MKRLLLEHIKNLPGWHTRKRLVVFCVDDYGSIRLSSRKARDHLINKGLALEKRFDQFDSLETREDLEALFDVLSAVKDRQGNSAVFSAYVLCANPDFDEIGNSGSDYTYEPLPQTFAKLAESQSHAYEGAWSLWREGIRLDFLRPQFHGREHLNVTLFELKLRARDFAVCANIANRSLAALGGEKSMPGVGFTHAFGLWNRSEIARHEEIIIDGLRLFEKTFGFMSTTFTPPAQRIHPDLYSLIDSLGLRGVFKPRLCRRRLDRNRYLRELNLTERNKRHQHLSLFRNVVFEPTMQSETDAVSLAIHQIAAAFRCRKPAVVSSHRVNFGGHIDPKNRRQGLTALKQLLREIVRRWPDVHFLTADQLVEHIELA